MFDEEPEDKKDVSFDTPPPTAEKMVFNTMKRYKRIKSAHIPDNLFVAAQWWIDHQEGPDEYRDRPEKQHDKKGEVTGWSTPYHDRLCANLRVFLAFSEVEKAFVLNGIAKGVPYRGDTIEFYKSVIHYSGKRDEYVKQYGLAADGKLPIEYTRRVGQMIRRAAANMQNLPYDKNERGEI